jgi:seryl-tRNA synthetase
VIDLRIVRADPERVRASQRARGEDEAAVDRLVAADARRREAATRVDRLRAEQKALGRDVAKAKGDARNALLARAKELAAAVDEAREELAAAEEALREAHLQIPNLVEEGTPPGGEGDAVVLESHGSPPRFEGFAPRDHVELGRLLGALDLDRAAKVSGARFYYLTGVGAELELALVNLAFAKARAWGFVAVVPPVLVQREAMEGTGFLGRHAAEVYRLRDDELYLVGTAEVPLAALHSDEVLKAEALPIRYVGFSSCFRREAGAHGRDTRGIMRVHQFDKVEMFSFCRPEEASAEHRRLLGWQQAFLDDLEVPYRVVDIAAGDLGTAAARKYDCEAWIPSQGRYREVTSTSNCTDFQARRLGIRARLGPDGAVAPVATLNGTLCAIPRTLVALLENHQRADGAVAVPRALQPYLGGREMLEPVA